MAECKKHEIGDTNDDEIFFMQKRAFVNRTKYGFGPGLVAGASDADPTTVASLAVVVKVRATCSPGWWCFCCR